MAFIEFMLQMILDAIEESTLASTKNDGISDGINVGLKLSSLDKAIIALIEIDAHITNAALAEKTGKSVRSVERRIKLLKDNHLLERIGAKKTGYWKVIK